MGKTDIWEPISVLCDALGLEPNNVRRLDMHLDYVEAEVFDLRDGHKFINEDGEASISVIRFDTTTAPAVAA